MRKNKLLLLLALLLTAATGAMAQSGTPSVKKLTVPDTWTGDMTTFSAADLPSDFAAVGDDVVTTIPAPTATGKAVLIYGFSGGETKYVEYANGVQSATDSRDFPRDQIYGYVNIMGYEGVYYTAAAGTASAPKHLITATYHDQTRLLEQPLPYATTIGELFEAVTGEPFSNLISTMSSFDMPLTGISSNNTSAVSIGELNGASTPVTVNADGKATVGINFGSYAHGIFVSVTSPLYAYMKDGVKDADKWTVKVDEGQAQALPIGGLKGDGSETVTLTYTGRLKVKGVKATSDEAPAAPTGNIVDLSTLTADYEAQDGDVLTGKTTSYKVTIAAGATVTLDGVNISSDDYCIKCLGDATIILKDGSKNTLTSTSGDYPALSIGDANTTLTIQGSTGVLNVTSGNYCAGIGGGYSNTNKTCGNIRIEGGVITAQGGHGGTGIGTDCGEATCGDIIITGGTITAKGGTSAAGIGTGDGSAYPVVCGDITIANTVTKVTATKGADASHSIGKGYGVVATCGTVTIGGTKYWENNAAVGDGATYLATSPLIYDPSAPAAPAGKTVDLSTLKADYEAQNGDVLTGTLNGSMQPYKITIADGATVTLDGAVINGKNNADYEWAGLNCLGNATIVLKDGTTNTVKGFYENYPGILVPKDKTLTIQGGTEGTGKLTASPCDGGTEESYGAGIGGGLDIPSGDISIEGGTVTATGGQYSAGIGGGYATCGNISITGGTVTAMGGPQGAGIGGGAATCGNISITGGTVTATGGQYAAGIGSGYYETCGNITIASTVKKVTATKGEEAPHSIGKGDGDNATCGTVTIGGTVYWQDNAALNDGDTYLGQATIIYPEP